MLSAIMILSSTTKPSTKTIPINEIKLIVSPTKPRKATVPKRVTGILTATQNAVFNDKNNPKTTIMRTSPTKALLVTIFNRLDTGFDLSSVTIKLIFEGYDSLSTSKDSLTFSVILITSAFSVFVTLRMKPLVPLIRVIVLKPISPSSIDAISFNKIVGPS